MLMKWAFGLAQCVSTGYTQATRKDEYMAYASKRVRSATAPLTMVPDVAANCTKDDCLQTPQRAFDQSRWHGSIGATCASSCAHLAGVTCRRCSWVWQRVRDTSIAASKEAEGTVFGHRVQRCLESIDRGDTPQAQRTSASMKTLGSG
jgi:hypothetical protein